MLDDPYRVPLGDASVDVVISGQAFEHCEFFWQVFEEMVSVLRPDGMIAPSAGPIHRYPVDCYRFYPDAYHALAQYAGCVLLDCWRDEREPWRDLVGVFRRADAPELIPSAPAAAAAHWGGDPGTDEEEALNGDISYLEVLDRLHRDLAPAHYLEIGVRRGRSLALARGAATGVDPAPDLDIDLPTTTRVLTLTSDDFFAHHSKGITPDFCFIDGMHLFDYALRDFMNIERCAAPGAIVAVDDDVPNHPAQALRTRRTRAWTGDVWRFVEVLRRHRPDLFLLPLDVSPAGLLVVAGLDPANRVLWDAYNPVVRETHALVGPPPDVLERRGAVDPAGAELTRVVAALKRARDGREPPHAIVDELRRASKGGVTAHRPAGAASPSCPSIWSVTTWRGNRRAP